MKIKASQQELTRAIRKLIGIDIIIDTVDEAKKALNMILEKTETSKNPFFKTLLTDILITQKVEHATTAMEHQVVFVIEFVLGDENYLPLEIELIQELQKIFTKGSA